MSKSSPFRKFRVEIKLPTYCINYYYDSKLAFSKDLEILKCQYDMVKGFILLDGRYNKI